MYDTATSNFDSVSLEKFRFNATSEVDSLGGSVSIDNISGDTTNEKLAITSTLSVQIQIKYKVMSRTFSSANSSFGASFSIKIRKDGIGDSFTSVFTETISPYNLYGVSTGSEFTALSDNITLNAGNYFCVLDDMTGFDALSVRVTEFNILVQSNAQNTVSQRNRVSTLQFTSNGTDTAIYLDTAPLMHTQKRLVRPIRIFQKMNLLKIQEGKLLTIR